MFAKTNCVVRFVQLASFAFLLVPGLTGFAASMVSSKEELQSLGDNEGIVIGSFVINVEKGKEDESSGAFLEGRKAGDFEYGVTITERQSSAVAEAIAASVPFRTSYGFEVKPEQEFTFLKKLPAGTYQIRNINQLGFSTLSTTLSMDFTVKPRQTTYIGRLAVQFPNRAMALSQVTTRVTDAQEETINSLRKEHGDSLFANVAKELMSLRSSATWSTSSVDTGAAASSSESAQPTPYDKILMIEGDIPGRKYSSLGDVTVSVNKLTIFHAAPTRDMVNQKLKEEAAKLGADAVIFLRYGTVGMTALSYGGLEGKGRAI
jgi:hypothetical protein